MLMTILMIMTTIPIAFQMPMKDVFGADSCQIFWTIQITYLYQITVAGSGMAAFRVICLRDFLPNMEKKFIAKFIIAIEVTIGILLLGVYLEAVALDGWDKIIFYQYCMLENIKSIDVTSLESKVSNDEYLARRLRQGIIFVHQLFILAEFLMYIWLILALWNHDKEKFREGIITPKMREERNRKNVITIKGQIVAFVTELVGSALFMIDVSENTSKDPSSVPAIVILHFTIVSVSQLFSSHELKRFIKAEWNINFS